MYIMNTYGSRALVGNFNQAEYLGKYADTIVLESSCACAA